MGGFELLVILAMIAFNSVFAANEIALAAVSVARLQVLDRENRPGATRALRRRWQTATVAFPGRRRGPDLVKLFGAVRLARTDAVA
jgi:hypothetical protein